jgi:hypothetical protein
MNPLYLPERCTACHHSRRPPPRDEVLAVRKVNGVALCAFHAAMEVANQISSAPEEGRCEARESGGVQCELPASHDGNHACPEALTRRLGG